MVNEIKRSGRPAIAAYGAIFLFAIHLVTYFIPSLRDVTTSSSMIGAEALALLAVAEHLILLPVIAALLAPPWARAVGSSRVTASKWREILPVAVSPNTRSDDSGLILPEF